MFRLELKSQQQLTEQRRRHERETQRERESNWESGSTREWESASVVGFAGRSSSLCCCCCSYRRAEPEAITRTLANSWPSLSFVHHLYVICKLLYQQPASASASAPAHVSANKSSMTRSRSTEWTCFFVLLVYPLSKKDTPDSQSDSRL